MSAAKYLHRREFLQKSAAGSAGLVVGFYLPKKFKSLMDTEASAPMALNAWVRIAPDETVTLIIDKSEMGTGVTTSLTMLLAEELECDWKKIRTEFAPAAPVYFNRLFGMQGTGGSTSVRASWEPLTQAGAAAREMLVAAAAKQWKVDDSSCRAENGVVTHSPTGRQLRYGQLAGAAAQLPIPEKPRLKDPKEYKYVGKSRKRLDTPDKITGKANFGIDVRLHNMLHAMVERCPVFGGKVASFDATQAKTIRGVQHVFQISSGVAVLADSTWAALQGRKALRIEWDAGSNANNSTGAIRMLYAERAGQPGAIARKEGDADSALATAAKKLDAVYEVPFLAHACMEPMNCAADVRPGSCDIYAPTQFQTTSQLTGAKITGFNPEQVRIHTTYLGGGFGRRAEQDFISEAVELSKLAAAPVQVTWTREDDLQHDFYRPAAYNRLWAGLDAEGWPFAWKHRVVSGSIFSRFFPGSVKNNLDRSATEGAEDFGYAFPHLLVDYVLTEAGVPLGFWRSVGHSQNGFVTECFLDEVARAGGKDPYELRRRLLSKQPRHLGVLDLAAAKAGWNAPLPAGRSRGIAVMESFGSFVAQVAEVSLDRAAGTVRVHRVVCAVDCGRYVNPDTVAAMMEGGIVYGLTAALKGAITINKGRVEQRNFQDYDMLRMNEMPGVEVHIVPSKEAPGGAGEPGTPPIAPAVCNAIFAATGKPIRRLPIRAEDLA